MAANLSAHIDARFDQAPACRVWTPSDFLDLAERGAVDKALQRKVARGDLRRIGRGLYDRPRRNSLTQSESPPDHCAVIEAIMRRDQTRALVDGMTAANDLGFTNAVPARIVVHTDARLRSIRLGNMEIEFRQTAARKLYWAGRPAMRLVQALHWVRDTLGHDTGCVDRYGAHLTALLYDPQNGPALRMDLASGFSGLPAWMQSMLRPHLSADLASRCPKKMDD